MVGPVQRLAGPRLKAVTDAPAVAATGEHTAAITSTPLKHFVSLHHS
jgi:hypothetical protein